MPWLQLKLDATPETADGLSDLLSEAGASAVTMLDAADQPLFEPPPGATPLWSQTQVIGLFTADTDMDAVIQQLKSAWDKSDFPNWQLNPLEDKDWVKAWMDNFKPMQFGERLWIIPGGYEAPEPDAINIHLDPGLAFGTGTHPTTAMCLNWLDAQPMTGKTVIDYGCGSGILAIAAALLGAEKVWATDIDPQALIATNDNAEKNQVTEKIEAMLPQEFPEIQADVMMANILAGPLTELAPLFARLTATNGLLVLSGVIESQKDEIIRAYQNDFAIELYQQQQEWICLSGTRKG
jgi:ribosomal protein L11 methyltransferase